MRRTAAIRLTLLSAASLAMVGCDDGPRQDVTEHIVTTEAACRATFGSAARDACSAAFIEAEEEHLASAPRFADTAQCQAETASECRVITSPSLASYAIPVMTGVLIGRAIGGGPRGLLPVYGGQGLPPIPGQPFAPGCSPGSAAPECAQRSGSSGSSTGSGGGGFRGARYAYAGRVVATGGATTESARSVSPTAQGSEALSRVANTSSIARGGLGSAGRGFGSAAS